MMALLIFHAHLHLVAVVLECQVAVAVLVHRVHFFAEGDLFVFRQRVFAALADLQVQPLVQDHVALMRLMIDGQARRS